MAALAFKAGMATAKMGAFRPRAVPALPLLRAQGVRRVAKVTVNARSAARPREACLV